MTPKQYLNQAYRIEKCIDTLLLDELRIEAMATKITSVTDREPVQGGDSHNKVEDGAIRLAEIHEQIREQVLIYCEMREQIVDTIHSVDDLTLRTVLYQRYILRHKWDDIADLINFDVRTVYRLHGKALAEVSKILSVNVSK